MFCSPECEAEDTARLIEGNDIIEAAEKQEVGFTDINKLKLDTNMPLAAKALQELKSKNEQDKQQLNNLLGFNRKQDVNDNEDKDSL